MIILGLLLVFGLGPEPAIGTQHLTAHGGFMPNGLSGVMFALVAVTFTFGGIMSIGTAAGEADDPDHAIPRAVRSVIWRILVFYIGGIGTILLLAPWNEQESNESPFIRVLTGVGYDGAATLLNVVIVIAVASVLNTMTYSGARTLRDLARSGQAPAALAKTSEKGLPFNALLFNGALMGVVVILNYFFEGKIFAVLLAIIVGTELITWAGICVSHLNFRKRMDAAGKESHFKAPLYPVANWICIAFFIAVLAMMAYLPEYRMGLFTLVAWILTLTIIGNVRKRWVK